MASCALLVDTTQDKECVIFCVPTGNDAEEVGWLLSDEGVALRTGHQCK